jgi:hypothetical protein
MAEQYVAYLRWNVREDWKRLGEQGRDGGALYPYAFGSDLGWFPKFIGDGTILWIVSAPLYRSRARGFEYRLPPTLIARLTVASVQPGSNEPQPRKVLPEQYRWVATADRRRSEYLPINNAFYALTEIDFVNRRGRVRRIPRQPARRFDPEHPYAHVPQYLQNVSRLAPLAPGSEQVLESLAWQVREQRTLFLSYAREESGPGAGDYAARLVEQLRREQFAPWLDMTFVPQLGPDDKYVDPELEQILDDGMRQSSILVALTGPLYRSHSWTGREWSLAKKWADEGSLRLLQVPVGGELMDPSLPLVQPGDPTETARKIRVWWERDAI